MIAPLLRMKLWRKKNQWSNWKKMGLKREKVAINNNMNRLIMVDE
jgi:hypothetical protein